MAIVKETERSPSALRKFIVKGNEHKAAGLRGPPGNITLPCLLALQLRCVVSRFSLKSPPNAPLTYTAHTPLAIPHPLRHVSRARYLRPTFDQD